MLASAVPFASAEDTILTQLEWARDGDSERQYDDAVGVLRIQAGSLDEGYLDRKATELGIRDRLDRAKRRSIRPQAVTCNEPRYTGP